MDPRHTYGYPDSGTTESIKGDFARRRRAFLAAELFSGRRGPWSLQETSNWRPLKPLLEKRFRRVEGWEGPAPPALGSPETNRRQADSCGPPRSAAGRRWCASRWGWRDRLRDYAPVEVMNTDLGGLFLKPHQHGTCAKRTVTRTAAGSFLQLSPGAPDRFVVFSDVRTDADRFPATSEVFSELRRMRETQMTPAETPSFEGFHRAVAAGGGFERGTGGGGRPSRNFSPTICRWIITRLCRITSTPWTIEQAQAMAQKYVQPEKMIVSCGRRPLEDRRRDERS